MGFFLLGSQERVRNSHGERAISVRAMEVLLYAVCRLNSDGEVIVLVSLTQYDYALKNFSPSSSQLQIRERIWW